MKLRHTIVCSLRWSIVSQSRVENDFYQRNAMLERYLLSPRVRPSVCLSQAGSVSKLLNKGSQKQRHTIAHGL